MAASKYSEELAKRGFQQISGVIINREMRRRLAKDKRAGPTFTQSTELPLMTFATDETHHSWMAEGLVDLSDLGFENHTLQVHEDMRRIFGTENKNSSYQ